jgi:hypothetical protein
MKILSVDSSWFEVLGVRTPTYIHGGKTIQLVAGIMITLYHVLIVKI